MPNGRLREVRQCDCSEVQTACTLHGIAGLVTLSVCVWGGEGGGALSQEKIRVGMPSGQARPGAHLPGGERVEAGVAATTAGGRRRRGPVTARCGGGGERYPAEGGWGIVSRGPEHGRCMPGREV